MAEVFCIGTILGASGFPRPELCAKFAFIAGDGWDLIEGEESGQTQVDVPGEDDRFSVWSHPVGGFYMSDLVTLAETKNALSPDVHYTTKTLAGWPKLIFQVYHQDMFGRNELFGYGFVHVPTTPGTHTLDVVTWRPAGTFTDQVWAFFLGATPQLKSMDLIHNPSDRFRLQTVAMGKVHVQLSVIVKGFDKHGVQL